MCYEKNIANVSHLKLQHFRERMRWKLMDYNLTWYTYPALGQRVYTGKFKIRSKTTQMKIILEIVTRETLEHMITQWCI